jgi:glycopeptide antibiotics resistance protein
VIFQIAFFSRMPGSRTGVFLRIGETWGNTVRAHTYVIENIMMLVPFGFFFPLIGRKATYCCIPLAIGGSMLLEGVQFLSKRGYCQLDDVIANTAGAVIGFVVMMLFVKVRQRGVNKRGA